MGKYCKDDLWTPEYDNKCCKKKYHHKHYHHHHCKPYHHHHHCHHDDITCEEAAKEVYELACGAKEIMDDVAKLGKEADHLVKKAFKLAEEIRESC